MPDTSPPSGRAAAPRDRPPSSDRGEQPTRPTAAGRPRRSGSNRSGKPGVARAERRGTRWRDIEWVEFSGAGEPEDQIQPAPAPQLEAPPTMAPPPGDDTFGEVLRQFAQPGPARDRAGVAGLATRFARLPVSRPTTAGSEPSALAASVLARLAIVSSPAGIDHPPAAAQPADEDNFPASILTPVGAAPAADALAPAGRAPRRRSRAEMLAGHARAVALRFAGGDPERLQRWLNVAGAAIVVAVVAYVVGAMIAGLVGSGSRPRTASNHPAPSTQTATAQPQPPAQSPPAPAAASPPSEPVARAAYYLARAKAGDPVAQYDVAVLYAQGRGLVQDYASAASWFHAAAAQGVVDAEYNLGVLYERGLGVTASPVDAVNWYRSAADQNHAGAQYNLAIAYTEGRGTEQDLAAAARWYQRAAQQGLAPAMFNLAILYERGQGVDRSLIDAYAWYSAAAKRGYDPAKKRAAELFGQFNDQDKAKAQESAATIAASISGAPPA